jgi:hypothetical protein
MGLTWMLAALFLFSDALHMRDYLETAGRLGSRAEPAAATPMRQAYPAVAVDAMTWVRHSLSLVEGEQVRLRYTHVDNAPDGREVHWNSAWAWAIAGAGRIYQWVAGGAIEHAIEKATLWLNPFAFMVAIIALSSWTARRAGAAAGAFVAAAMMLQEHIAEGFLPAYVDHHGLLSVCVLGVVLGAVAMGGGWLRARLPNAAGLLPESASAARSGAWLSAASGAVGLWISAASVAPAIAVVGAAGIFIAIDRRSGPSRVEAFDGDSWRTWGRAGAVASLGFYLHEYFPGHLSWHLEANHPLYSLAWLGGAELVARVGERRTGARDLLWPAAAVLAAPIIALVAGTRVLAFADPFVAGVHRDIGEFRPLWSTLRRSDAGLVFRVVVIDMLPLVAAVATLVRRRNDVPVAIAFATLVAGALEAMAWWQTRWQMNASAAQIPLALLLVAYWTGERARTVRWSAAAAVVATVYAPGAIVAYAETLHRLDSGRVSSADAGMVLSRDIAGALRASRPRGEIVVLASPNVSVRVGYYGRFATIGTLYWENGAGLKAAARIFSEESDEAICRLLDAHHVTHVVFVSNQDFAAEYYTLLHPDATPRGWLRSLGGRIAAGGRMPACMQPLAYQVPGDLEIAGADVRLYAVAADAPSR